MKKSIQRITACCIAALAVFQMAVPVAAQSEKEEVVYANLTAAGALKNTYVVNSFEGGNIVDYGAYTAVKMLNSNATIHQDGDTISFSAPGQKVYYQGDLENVQLPWTIELHYYLDGKEYSASEIAGKTGRFDIHFKIAQNPSCTGDFYDNYALQATFTLDTERCRQISAPDATVANVGSKKQLTYTILSGQGIDTVISADVRDFKMDAVTINGIHLNFDVDVDDSEMKEQINAFVDAVSKLNNGAAALHEGAVTLEDGTMVIGSGTSSLHSGITTLDDGAAQLQEGVNTVQAGLNQLNSQSDALVTGSESFKEALSTVQSAVNAVEVSNEDLMEMVQVSGQVKQAIDNLSEGAATLQNNLDTVQYKNVLAQNGIEVDGLKEENTQAAAELYQHIERMESNLAQMENKPDTENEAAQLQSQIESLKKAASLLENNTMALDETEAYINSASNQISDLSTGLRTLDDQYQGLDAAVIQLSDTLSNMTENLAALKESINQLVAAYTTLNDVVEVYTQGVSQIVDGYGQVTEGAAALASGSKALASTSGNLNQGTSELYDGVKTLCSSAQALAEGTNTLWDNTSGMETEVEKKIDSLLASFQGEMENPASFVSSKNSPVKAVQFVLKTEPIQIEETTAKTVDSEPTLSFWQRIINLFK